MSIDRTYSQGGADMTDGVYPAEYGVASRLLRLVLAERGRWPGGRGELLGSRLYQIDRIGDNVEGEIRRALDEAVKPMIDDGSISDIDVSVEQVTDYGVIYTLTFTDRTTGDSVSRRLTAAWQG